MTLKLIAFNAISYFVGIIFFAVGTLNVFYGNDPFFGVFIMLLSLVYFPAVTEQIKQKIGISVPVIAKVLLFFFIVWVTLGVGEFFDKLDMMMENL